MSFDQLLFFATNTGVAIVVAIYLILKVGKMMDTIPQTLATIMENQKNTADVLLKLQETIHKMDNVIERMNVLLGLLVQREKRDMNVR